MNIIREKYRYYGSYRSRYLLYLRYPDIYCADLVRTVFYPKRFCDEIYRKTWWRKKIQNHLYETRKNLQKTWYLAQITAFPLRIYRCDYVWCITNTRDLWYRFATEMSACRYRSHDRIHPIYRTNYLMISRSISRIYQLRYLWSVDCDVSRYLDPATRKQCIHSFVDEQDIGSQSGRDFHQYDYLRNHSLIDRSASRRAYCRDYHTNIRKDIRRIIAFSIYV